MDRSRDRAAGVPGSLWSLINGHITRGGDVERAKKFVPSFELPAGSFGAASVRGQIFVFGSADLAASMPTGIRYQRLQNDPAVMTRVLDVDVINGKFYVFAEFDDGGIYHFYDGSRVTDWDTIADGAATLELLADYLADKINNESSVDALAFGTTITLTARTAGTAFTVSKSTVNGGANADQDVVLNTVQPNVPAISAISATGTVEVTGGTASPGTNRITSVTVGSIELLGDPVDWTGSNAATAAALAAEITSRSDVHTFSATALGAIVTVSAGVNTGSSGNGDIVSAVNQGDVTTSTTNMSGGADAVEAQKQVVTAELTGTLEAQDKFTIVVDGTAYSGSPRGAATGSSGFVSHQRIFSPAGDTVRYPKLGDPSDWSDNNTSTGAGFLPINLNTEGTERIVGAEAYGRQMAVFSREVISLYALNTDAEEIIFDQPVKNTGTRAARSIIGYGNNDLFYLDTSGIRSLRARQGTTEAYSNDTGSPIDSFIVDHMAELPQDKVSRAVAAIEPTDGRYMLAMGDRIYVLSYFPSKKITAWSYYEPGIEITDFVRARGRLYARAGDVIYLYGGDDNSTYPDEDEQPVEVELPFLSANTPATDKLFVGFDIALTNTWEVYVLPEADKEEQEIHAGGIKTTTYGKPAVPLPHHASVFALRLRCAKAGRASVSSLAVHYAPESSPQ